MDSFKNVIVRTAFPFKLLAADIKKIRSMEYELYKQICIKACDFTVIYCHI